LILVLAEQDSRALNTLAELTHHTGDYDPAAELALREQRELPPGDP